MLASSKACGAPRASAKALWKLCPCAPGRKKSDPRQKGEMGKMCHSVWLASRLPHPAHCTHHPRCPAFPHIAMPGFPTPNTRPASLSVPVPVSHSLSVSAALVNLRTKHPLRKCVSAHQVLRDRVGAGVCLGVSRGREIQKEKKKAFSLTLGSLYPRKENRLISRLLIIQDKHRNTSYVRSVGGYEKVWRRR